MTFYDVRRLEDQMRRIAGLALLLLLAVRAFAASTPDLPFLHDDYSKALAEARQRKLPIFVEVSAPW